jgi:hypothetical protein
MKRMTVAAVLASCCTMLGIDAPPPALADPLQAERSSSYYAGLVYRRPGSG